MIVIFISGPERAGYDCGDGVTTTWRARAKRYATATEAEARLALYGLRVGEPGPRETVAWLVEVES